ncbi:MAG: outer membrane beta-barrel protein [Betaproteobacteria bacterium]
MKKTSTRLEGATLLAALTLGVTPAFAETSPDPGTWSGPYLSAFAVGASSEVRGTSTRGDGSFSSNANDESAHDSFRGAGAGVLLGYQRHYPGGIILGVEADWAGLREEGRQDTLVNSGNAWNGMLQASIVREAQWLSTARVRLGYGTGPFMVSLTGGLALASLVETRTQYEGLNAPTQTVPRFSDRDHAYPIGWSWGVSGAWRMNDAWSLRVDYLQAHFDQVGFGFPDARGGVVSGSGFASVQGRSVSNDVRVDMLRLGLTYSFGNMR